MQYQWETPLTADEEAIITPFVTNTNGPIFGLRNLPEVVKGALFSRYSRSDKNLRRILLEEFIQAPEANFTDIVGIADNDVQNQLIAVRRADEFYDRVLIGYGDDSVAELGGAHLACEGISNIAAKFLEDSRIGLAPLEKSTRYVPFNRKIEGRYRYCREPSIMASSHSVRYETVLDRLFDTYSGLIDPMLHWVQAHTPRDETTSERAYKSATRAKALDLLRGLLPMATLTNVGMFGNGRAFDYLLTKLAATPHQEVRDIGQGMQAQLDLLIPAFVKRAKTERGAQYARYLAANRDAIATIARDLPAIDPTLSAPTVQLVEYDPDAVLKVVAAILYPQSVLPLAELYTYAAGLSMSQHTQIIEAYIGERGSRFQRPGRAFEETYYTFDLFADLGAYRDLHRHRILTQERQRYSVQHGYITPSEIEAAGLAVDYRAALEQAAEAVEIIGSDLPEAAQYAVPFAFRIRWRIKLNLREAYHLIELRSSRQGHPSYRVIAQEMYRQINAVHPSLARGMEFVDLNSYALERLASEQRIDTKRSS
jgi:thymidylate synthase ThyX